MFTSSIDCAILPVTYSLRALKFVQCYLLRTLYAHLSLCNVYLLRTLYAHDRLCNVTCYVLLTRTIDRAMLPVTHSTRTIDRVMFPVTYSLRAPVFVQCYVLFTTTKVCEILPVTFSLRALTFVQCNR